MKSGNLNFPEPSGPLQACNGTALPLPTIRNNLSVPSSRVKQSEKYTWSLKMGPIGCPDTSVTTYYTLRNVTEEYRLSQYADSLKRRSSTDWWSSNLLFLIESVMRLCCGVHTDWYVAAIFSSVDDVHYEQQFLICNIDLEFVSAVTRFDARKCVILWCGWVL